MSKKRKIAEENRNFKERWTEEFFFVHVQDKALIQLQYSEFNLKRHYETMHQGVVANLSADEKTKKIEALKKQLKGQQSVFLKFHEKNR